MMKKVVTEMRCDAYGRKGKCLEMAADKCGGGYVEQQEQHEQRKWNGNKSERGVIEIGTRGDEVVVKKKPNCWASNERGY